MSRKKIFVITCLIIILVGYFIEPIKTIKEIIIKNDYINYQEEFTNIASYLSEHSEPYIYISTTTAEDETLDDTINYKESNFIFSNKAGMTLKKIGYSQISKDHGGIYFYKPKYKDLQRTRGIMYYPNGFEASNNPYVTKFVELQKNWYYFEEY